MPTIINNREYFTIAEITAISGVNMRTLRRWIANGDLDHFLHAYQGKNMPMMFRLEPPDETDRPYDGYHNTYHLPEETMTEIEKGDTNDG